MEIRLSEIQIGAIRGQVICDSENQLTEERVAALFPQHAERMIALFRESTAPPHMSRNVLYLETDGRRVLIDSGIGGLDPRSPGAVVAAMNDAGLPPAGVDTVIISHFHGDHFGGLLDANGEAAFPNARIVVGREEYNNTMDEAGLAAQDPSRANALRGVAAAYADRIKLVDGEAEVEPGVCLLPLPGHTPGHNGVLVTSNGETLLHAVDAIHFPIQLNALDSILAFDRVPDLAVSTRRALLERIEHENLRLMTYHFPFPGVGYIDHAGDQRVWLANT